MDYDAFTGGIAPGGLRSKDEIKILICYLLSQVNEPLTKDMVLAAVLHDGLANYFEVGEAVHDLILRGNVVSALMDDVETLRLTSNGQSIAQRLEQDLPRSVRDRAVRAALHMLTRERNERENHVEIIVGEEGVHVECSVMDRGNELMCLRLFVGDKMQAEQVRDAFYDHPGLVYAATIATLTGDHNMLRKLLNEQLPPGYTDYLNE